MLHKHFKTAMVLALVTFVIFGLGLLATTQNAYAAYGDRTMQVGTSGDDVKTLQSDLKTLGYDTKGIDGVFGQNTKNAVIAFQKANSLTQDGIVGPATFAAIEKQINALDNPSLLQVGSTGDAVKTLQTNLTSLGYDTKGTDGIFGQNTKNAVIAFQQANNLTADGIVGPNTSTAIQNKLNDPGTEPQNPQDGSLSRGSTGEAVRSLQSDLTRLGFDTKGIDGVFGPNTEDAVIAFQYANNLEANGIVSSATKNLIAKKIADLGDQPSNPGTTDPTKDPVTAANNFWKERSTWLQPVKGAQISDPTGGSRYFNAPRNSGTRSHAAVDFIAPVGTPVYAMADGTVTTYSINTFFEGTGSVAVENYDGSVARYCEIRPSNAIINGQTKVKRGDVIGTVVANYSGTSMLHLEMYLGYDLNGKKVTGSLSQSNYTYWYVTPKNGSFQRRADLINPTGSIYLPTK